MGEHRSQDQAFEANLAMWDEMTGVHITSDFYDVDGFIEGGLTLHGFEPGELGSVRDCSLIHLQCHLGLDSMSWARLGAQVTGLDFSPAAVAAASDIARTTGLDATFVEGNVYDAPKLAPGPFDVVYTGLGALNWLPDLSRWASVVSSLLKPGGRFYLLEFHPLLSMLSDVAIELDPSQPYFHDPSGSEIEDDRDYADGDARLANATSIEWAHPLSEVIGSLLDEGLELKMFHEHDIIAFRPWPFLEQIEPGVQRFRIPDGLPKIPLEYSLLVTKPVEGPPARRSPARSSRASSRSHLA
jgi:SAM-dependent methyltransferase